MSALLQIIEHGDIHELRLNRPPVNALNPELLTALCAAVEAAPERGAQGLILSGGPSVFSAGLDVPYLLTQDRAGLKAGWSTFFAAMGALAQSPVPVVAAIGGHSPAGGAVLSLCCDYRVMARGDWRIGLNEVQVGLIVPEGVQYLLRRLVGARIAERLLVAGAMIDAEQALRIGMVDELADGEAVVAQALAWLHATLALPRKPMLNTRAMARADLIAAVVDPARIDLDRFLDDWFSDDTQAALKAMVARLKKPG